MRRNTLLLFYIRFFYIQTGGAIAHDAQLGLPLNLLDGFFTLPAWISYAHPGTSKSTNACSCACVTPVMAVTHGLCSGFSNRQSHETNSSVKNRVITPGFNNAAAARRTKADDHLLFLILRCTNYEKSESIFILESIALDGLFGKNSV